MEKRSVPITYPARYREYERLLSARAMVLPAATGCQDACRAAGGRLSMTCSTVERKIVLLEPDDGGELRTVEVVAVIARARCGRCRGRFRVLPCDLLPRKTYSLAVIEDEVARYARGDVSLREVAWRQRGHRTPAHTTL